MGRAGKILINGEVAEEDDEPRLAAPLHKPRLCGGLHVGADAKIAEQQRSFVPGEPDSQGYENQPAQDTPNALSLLHDLSLLRSITPERVRVPEDGHLGVHLPVCTKMPELRSSGPKRTR